MTRVELTEARAPLADYARKARRGPVVLTRRGRPIALLRLLTDEERENFLVSTHPGFVEMIRRSREECPPGSGVALEDVERELGLSPAQAVARGRRRSRGATKRGKGAVAKYARMKPEGLRAATKVFDREIAIDESRPLSAAERKAWEAARRK